VELYFLSLGKSNASFLRRKYKRAGRVSQTTIVTIFSDGGISTSFDAEWVCVWVLHYFPLSFSLFKSGGDSESGVVDKFLCRKMSVEKTFGDGQVESPFRQFIRYGTYLLPLLY